MNYHQQELEFPAPSGRQDKVIKVIAQVAEGTGLAYHVPPGCDETVGFVITHLASMKAICYPMDTKYEIKLLLESVAGITDWYQSEHEIGKLSIGTEVRNLQADIAEQVNKKLESAMRTCMPECLVEEVMKEIGDEDSYSTIRKALVYALNIVE